MLRSRYNCKEIATTAAIALCLIVNTTEIRVCADELVGVQGVHNPLRRDHTRLAEAPSPRTQPTKLRSDSGPVFRVAMRPTNGKLAIDQILHGPSGICPSKLNENDDSVQHGQQQLNETNTSKTLKGYLPPTIGVFRHVDQKWVFVPENSVSIVESERVQVVRPANRFRIETAIDRLRTSTGTQLDLEPTNPLRAQTTGRLGADLDDTNQQPIPSGIAIKQLVCANDYVLARIIKSLQSKDDGIRWLVDGNITDANQIGAGPLLRIRSAVNHEK